MTPFEQVPDCKHLDLRVIDVDREPAHIVQTPTADHVVYVCPAWSVAPLALDPWGDRADAEVKDAQDPKDGKAAKDDSKGAVFSS